MLIALISDLHANRLALDTCSHGAGRKLGRGAVRRANVGVDIRSEMEAEGVILVCPPESDALDEAGRAYKDIESVMAYQSDLARPVHSLRPLGVVGRIALDDRSQRPTRRRRRGSGAARR